jgi:small subunit ribosomal protein S13
MADKTLPENFKHIIRIANVDLPGQKKVSFALTNIKGIGINFAEAVCFAAKVDKLKKAGVLSPEEVERLNAVLLNPAKMGIPTWMFNRKKDYETGEHKHLLTGSLQFTQENDLKRLKKIKTYRGVRHIKGLPVRGQRTRSNFRHSKGKVVGVAKKQAPAKAASGKESAKKDSKSKK